MKQLVLTAFFFAFVSAACAQLPPAPVGDPAHPDTVIDFGSREIVLIQTSDGPVEISALVADSDRERQRGLMFVDEMAQLEGMIFDYGAPQPVSMWMRNTVISLDIVFISEAGEIVKIIAHAQPLSLRSLESDFPVLSVLELSGGATQALGIRPGDQVFHRIFGNEPPVSADLASGEQDEITEETAADDLPSEE